MILADCDPVEDYTPSLRMPERPVPSIASPGDGDEDTH
jgi:hypothetical protein